ncbi:hypothetical protein JVT61DRAFT_2885 [Boletus reticuloceps]|uniref:Uncharacterized protein n=1 Tax=Boletus reticuloceps TaxID=495285 RepID=A0A8I2YPX5_9AGAM|nr:hypothetical protein JVT61DRAFT_2885 [Boletus reticuloceps]
MPAWLANKVTLYPSIQDYDVASMTECMAYWKETSQADVIMSSSFDRLSLKDDSPEAATASIKGKHKMDVLGDDAGRARKQRKTTASTDIFGTMLANTVAVHKDQLELAKMLAYNSLGKTFPKLEWLDDVAAMSQEQMQAVAISPKKMKADTSKSCHTFHLSHMF